MQAYRYFVVGCVLFLPLRGVAETFVCEVKNNFGKDTLSVAIDMKTNRGHFALPKVSGTCTLAYFDQKSGLMISCQFPEGSYVQSDRSGLEELPIARLSFKNAFGSTYIEADCANKKSESSLLQNIREFFK